MRKKITRLFAGDLTVKIKNKLKIIKISVKIKISFNLKINFTLIKK